MGRRIIFDVGHPAQVHNFKYVYHELVNLGWTGLFTAKDKEVTIRLLQNYQLPFEVIGKSEKRIIWKIASTFSIFFRFFRVLIKFRPDLVVCRFSLHAVWCSRLLGIKVIGLADTEHTKFLDALTVTLANVKLTGKSYERSLGKNHFRYNGNIELFYLHPRRYILPRKKPEELDHIGNKNYALIRFVAWNAHHDVGEKGFTRKDKLKIVRLLEKKYKILISSEGELPPDLKNYQIKIPPEKMHDVIAFSSLYIGEGASMASEAACLGIPSIYVNSLDAGSLKEEEQSGLLINLRNSEHVCSEVVRIIEDPESGVKAKNNLRHFLQDKIDVTSFLTWLIDNHPSSINFIKENKSFQEQFR